jgi:hypothetical protein
MRGTAATSFPFWRHSCRAPARPPRKPGRNQAKACVAKAIIVPAGRHLAPHARADQSTSEQAMFPSGTGGNGTGTHWAGCASGDARRGARSTPHTCVPDGDEHDGDARGRGPVHAWFPAVLRPPPRACAQKRNPRTKQWPHQPRAPGDHLMDVSRAQATTRAPTRQQTHAAPARGNVGLVASRRAAVSTTYTYYYWNGRRSLPDGVTGVLPVAGWARRIWRRPPRTGTIGWGREAPQRQCRWAAGVPGGRGAGADRGQTPPTRARVSSRHCTAQEREPWY